MRKKTSFEKVLVPFEKDDTAVFEKETSFEKLLIPGYKSRNKLWLNYWNCKQFIDWFKIYKRLRIYFQMKYIDLDNNFTWIQYCEQFINWFKRFKRLRISYQMKYFDFDNNLT